MAGIHTVRSFESYAEAMTFSLSFPEATRIVERDPEYRHRHEYPLPHRKVS